MFSNLDGEEILTEFADIDIPSVARRQLIASAIAGVVILFAACLTALGPAHHSPLDDHRFAVQQPSFVTSSGQRVAIARPHEIELP